MNITWNACTSVIIQIDEHTDLLSEEFKNSHPDIAWRDIKNIRNLYTHNYKSVMFDILWVTMKNDVPQLRKYLEKLH